MMTLLAGALRMLIMGLVVAVSGAGLVLSGLGIGLAWPRPEAVRPPAGPLDAEPILGLEFEALTPALVRQESLGVSDGAVIRTLAAGGPAARAGLRVGDVIQSVNGLPIDSVHGLAQAVLAMHPGGVLELAVWRAGEALTVRVELSQPRADEQAQSAPLVPRPSG